jgi:hypothetical protein
MKYRSPQVHSAGVASKLIQSKADQGSDGTQPIKVTVLSTLLEAR